MAKQMLFNSTFLTGVYQISKPISLTASFSQKNIASPLLMRDAPAPARTLMYGLSRV